MAAGPEAPRATAIPIAIAIAAIAIGCALDRAGLGGGTRQDGGEDAPDAAACRDQCRVGGDCCIVSSGCVARGARRADGCGLCDPDRSVDAWIPICDRSFVDDTFDDLRAGTSPDHGADLFVSIRGEVRPIHERDLDADGHVDVVVTQSFDGVVHVGESLVYLGSPTGPTTSVLGLPAIGATGALAADLDDDGSTDLLFCEAGSDTSRIYRGSATGFSPASAITVRVRAAHAAATADLDRDGFLDLVLAVLRERSDSAVLFGSPSGFGPERTILLPTIGAFGVAIGDVDDDGWLDLAFSSFRSDSGFMTESHVFTGAADGFDANRSIPLPTHGATEVEIADVDADGALDVVFAQYYDGSTIQQPILVYRGPELDPSRLVEFPAVATIGLSLGDANRDGALDFLLGSLLDPVTGNMSISRVLFGGAPAPATMLPTIGAYGASLIDLNGDGAPEAILPGFTNGTRYDVGVRIFDGTPTGPSPNAPLILPSRAAHLGITRDPGSIFDRAERWFFESRVHDAGEPARAGTLRTEVTTSRHSTVRFQIRSAPSEAELASARWSGPDGTEATSYEPPEASVSAVHDGDRFFQWRAILARDRAVRGPIVHRVELTYGH